MLQKLNEMINSNIGIIVILIIIMIVISIVMSLLTLIKQSDDPVTTHALSNYSNLRGELGYNTIKLNKKIDNLNSIITSLSQVITNKVDCPYVLHKNGGEYCSDKINENDFALRACKSIKNTASIGSFIPWKRKGCNKGQCNTGYEPC